VREDLAILDVGKRFGDLVDVPVDFTASRLDADA
jgi:hypothetical protein